MGKQIRFLLVGNDETELLDVICENGDKIIDRQGQYISRDDLILKKKDYGQIYIKSPKAILKKELNGFVDVFNSNVVELVRSDIKDKRIICGRLYIPTILLDEKGNLVRPEKWLEEQYKFYKKWIIKHCKISKNKWAYVGQIAYSLYKAGGYKLLPYLGKPEFDRPLEFD